MKKIYKNIFIAILLSFLLVLLIYVSNITSIPNNIILFRGEKLGLKILPGIELQTNDYTNYNLGEISNYRAVQTSTTLEEQDYTGKVNLSVKLLGKVDLKDITVNVIENTKVVPLGNIVGVKLYTNGVLVVGMSEISGVDNKEYKPYENTGIKEGDMIVEVNEKTVTCTADLLETVNKSQGKEVSVKYVRNGDLIQTSIKPVETANSNYKLGLWVRDAAAGVGTVSYYEPSTNSFAALGHGILDVDTDQLLDIASGEFITTNIVSITKGEKGNPGKIQGSIENQTTVGKISKNTGFGVFGTLNNMDALNVDTSGAMDIALRNEIKTGKASIICTLENNVRKEYEVEIQKIFKNNNEDNKSMIIKVTDEELLNTTGGIIQGMSGSPILQDGKVVGALTHVLVNDPTMGYGVFADLMIKQSRQVE